MLRAVCVFLVCTIVAATSQAATSLTQFGITWTFDADYQTGQFANGDYWVVGPVTIESISPKSTFGRHGSMIDPVPNVTKQGFDDRMQGGANKYEHANNVAARLPIRVEPGSSIMSSISNSADIVSHTASLDTIAILTVVDQPPAAGSFRPPPVGGLAQVDKNPQWTIADLDYSRLARVPSVAGMPNLRDVESFFERPWIETLTAWNGRYRHPRLNQPGYGRDMAHRLATGLLSLQLDYSNQEKQKLLVRMVQVGIDIWGSARTGAAWNNEGGHNQGRKMPMLLAGTVLNSPKILEYADASRHIIFQEDRQTWYVNQNDVGRELYTADGRPREKYIQSDVGVPEWGEKHYTQPNRDGRNWGTYYRDISGSCTVGHILAARLMGVEDQWNWPAAFDYYDRFFAIEESRSEAHPNRIQPYVAEMWRRYRDNSDWIPPPTTDPQPIGNEPGGGGSAGVSIQPDGGIYLNDNILVQLQSGSADVRYTLDGSSPTDQSPAYDGPILLSSSSTLNVRTFDGGTPSAVETATFEVAEIQSLASWKNAEVNNISNKTLVQFDATPDAAPMDGVIGVATSSATGFRDLAAIVRFAPSGYIDARNGSAYSFDNAISYTPGIRYTFELEIDPLIGTYSVWVKSENSTRIPIGLNYAFREEQRDAKSLSFVSTVSIEGSLVLSNFAFGKQPNPPQLVAF